MSEIKASIDPSKVTLWMVAALWVGWMLFVLHACTQAFTHTFTPSTIMPTPTTTSSYYSP